MTMAKQPRDKSQEYDPLAPLKKSNYILKDNDCFGKECDLRDNACYQCGDREICSVLTQDTLSKKAKEVEEIVGSPYLDEADFANLDYGKLEKYVDSGNTTVKELLAYISEQANCADNISVIEYAKRWIKSTPNIYTQDGVVWKR